MKYGILCLFISFGMAFAHQFPGPPGPNITDCAKWSGMTHCKDWYGPPAHVGSQATLCMSNHNADGFVVYHQYRRDPDQPPVPFYKIYVRYCYKWVYGTIAHTPMQSHMANQVMAFLPGGALASNSHYNEAGQIMMYVMDPQTETIFETKFDEEGNLLEMVDIDPTTNEYFIAVAETSGLEFGAVASE